MRMTTIAGRGRIEIVQIEKHRNGVSAAPFHAVTFIYQVGGEETPRRMVAIVFAEAGHIAVFDREALGRGEIAWGGTDEGRNSWRGDSFEAAMRSAIAELAGGDTFAPKGGR